VALAIAQERQGARDRHRQLAGRDRVARENAERGLDVEFMIAALIVGGPTT
jgi:hypothetical protein